MEGLSVNEAALILCILGALRNGERFYPSVEESLRYMKIMAKANYVLWRDLRKIS